MHLQIFVVVSLYFMIMAVRGVPMKVPEKNLYYAGHVASLSSVSHHNTDLPSHFLLIQNSVCVTIHHFTGPKKLLVKMHGSLPILGLCSPLSFFGIKEFSCLLLLGSSSGSNLLRHVINISGE